MKSKKTNEPKMDGIYKLEKGIVIDGKKVRKGTKVLVTGLQSKK